MKITRTTSLPAGVEDAFAVIASQEHQAAKVGTWTTESSATVTEQVGGAVGVHTERELPTRGMPAAVTSMVGSTLRIIEQQNWSQPMSDGSRSADLEITVVGVPLRLIGRTILSPAGDGSRLAVDADLDCSLPFVGRKIEAAARPAIEESFDLEVRLLTEQLR
ncbi:DUF2505 domain-containing protein [Janibacter sp. GS2]|uniref:DUF2505 domain-containing protein n=1 Tax=Janibacter sp. GS2 TaxID=3442646 RepID=UPI003EBB1378